MKVKPKLAFKLLSSGMPPLDPNKVYEAIHATNQPHWIEREAIFIIAPEYEPIGFLLERGDYEMLDEE